MRRRWIIAAVLAVLLGALLAHEDAFEDGRDATVKIAPGRTAGP
jgi:hypothetical protein